MPNSDNENTRLTSRQARLTPNEFPLGSCILIATFILICSILVVYSNNLTGPLHPRLNDNYTSQLTKHGQPNLQGVWTNVTITPLQRPRHLDNKNQYNEEEVEELEAIALQKQIERDIPLDANRSAPESGKEVGQEADFDFYGSYNNIAYFGGEYRTSLIVSPEDGRFPYVEGYLTKDYWGQQKAKGLNSFDGPEGRPSGERCLDRGLLTSLVRIVPYNHNYQIIQNKDYVVIHAELAHDVRIIKINGNYLPGNFNHWHGDSIGRWEDNTLVVESKNFRPEQSSNFLRMTDAITVVETFTRVSENEIEYTYELNDPNIYKEIVRVEMPLILRPSDFRIYEYACHEGNYSMPSILAGARLTEQNFSK